MNRITIYGLLLFTSILAESAQAENGKLSGYMFGDYYYIASSDTEEREAKTR